MSRLPSTFIKNVYYHVFNKSIDDLAIFHDSEHIRYFLAALDYYQSPPTPGLRLSKAKSKKVYRPKPIVRGGNQPLQVLTYCVMPTHYHLIVRVEHQSELFRYINTIENCYTRYFNQKKNRKGTAWIGPYKRVPIGSGRSFIHVMRYIHLNPVTAYLVDTPEDWSYSSYRYYMRDPQAFKVASEMSIKTPLALHKFTQSNIGYQRKLSSVQKEK
jgi:putative transposase